MLWSESGKSCIAYRVVSGVMLASGDPLGDPEAWPGAIQPFVGEAERHAWTPAVIGCSQLGGEVWCRETSYDALELGDEAVVEVADFTLEGRAMRNVRQMVKRVQRAGYDDRGVPGAGPHAGRAGGHDPAGQALAGRRHRARVLDGAGPARATRTTVGCVLVSAHKDGVLRAFLHFVPWGPRRHLAGPDAP